MDGISYAILRGPVQVPIPRSDIYFTVDREIPTKISEKLVKMILLKLLVKQFYFNKNSLLHHF